MRPARPSWGIGSCRVSGWRHPTSLLAFVSQTTCVLRDQGGSLWAVEGLVLATGSRWGCRARWWRSRPGPSRNGRPARRGSFKNRILGGRRELMLAECLPELF